MLRKDEKMVEESGCRWEGRERERGRERVRQSDCSRRREGILV